jgi:CheY-like chemotaxis protein
MMGGDIHVESEMGKGATFSFEIPVELVHQSSIINHQSSIQTRGIGVEPGQHAADGGPYRLLIVEDKEESRKLMMNLLKPLGFDMRAAQNGEEAVALWSTWHPHLIWMDMRMPVMDGYEATRRIRTAEAANAETQKLNGSEDTQGGGSAKSQIKNLKSKIPIIALTASAFEEDRTKVLETGCDDFVRKPFREAEIFDMLRKYLGMRFVYESDHQPSLDTRHSTLDTALAPEALATLPEAWLATLEHGARETNTTLLFEVIEQIRTQNEAVAEELARLTNDFEYDMILALLQQAGERTMEEWRNGVVE